MYSYVGQAKHILTRLAQHLDGHTQHIDISLRKHKLYSEENKHGWQVEFKEIPQEHLDEFEKQYIMEYLRRGYQSRNKTLGGQDSGKVGLCENTAHKGYYDGKKQGYEDCRKYVKNILSKYVTLTPKSGKLPLRKYYEFLEFLGESEND
jgi:flagellar biosynthesis/type III secretory pathway protein FliH